MNDFLQTTTVNRAGGTAALIGAATLGILALKYNDRAMFTTRREGTTTLRGIPLFGILFDQINNKERILDWFNENINKLDTMRSIQ